MENKRDTIKIKRETYKVTQEAKDKLKAYNSIKKKIIEAMGDDEISVPMIAEKLKMNKSEILYYVMSLLKFGMIEVIGIDDMDEYYLYKIKK